ncbi:unnamed protein product [Rotaria magnacalcarata]|uniref:FLYWCH-type domain-containing protein n=1 Tax=Rotaria magnacalcarata TaxID=392030 RepID=A0A816RFQ1_9BILA|nr:unnamed protein product [Rotaria magnacalcarata]
MYSLIRTQKGPTAIYFENNFYRLQKQNKNGTKRWVCTNRSCSCSLLIKDERLQIVRGQHNHTNEKPSLSIIQTIDNLRQTVCSNVSKPITQIYNEILSTYRQNNGTAELVPMFDMLRSTLYRDRATVLPKLPHSLHRLILPNVFIKNLYNENMLFCDKKRPSRILGFASITAIKQLDLPDELQKESVKRQLANILSLPLLPINKIIAAFHDAADSLVIINRNFQTFVDYVEKTYITSPKFNPVNWNHYNTLSNRPRTNNQ